MTAALVLLACAVAVLGVLVVGLLRTHADILRALHELGVGLDESTGSVGPVSMRDPQVRTRPGVPEPRLAGADLATEPITGTTPSGGSVVVSLTPRAHATVLAFLSSGCTTCAAFWGAFRGEVSLPGDGTQLVIVTRGPEHESPSEIARLAPAGVTTVQSSEAWARFGVPGSPYFALVDGATGRIVGEGSATTWDHVTELLQRAVADGGLRLDGGRVAARAAGVTSDARSREARIDRDLAAAGITPGHASLYPTAPQPAADDLLPPHAHD